MSDCKDCRTANREIIRLRNIISELEEEIIQLRQLTLPSDWEPPFDLRLAKTEARLLAAFYMMDGKLLTKERMYQAVYYDSIDLPEGNTVDVFLCRLRKKIAPYKVTIHTVHRRGCYLDRDSLDILKEWGIGHNETSSLVTI